MPRSLSTAPSSTVYWFLDLAIMPFPAMKSRLPKLPASALDVRNGSFLDRLQRVRPRTGSLQNIIGSHERSLDIEQRPPKCRTQRVPAVLLPSTERVRDSPVYISTTNRDPNNQLSGAFLWEKTVSLPQPMAVPQSNATHDMSDPHFKLPQ